MTAVGTSDVETEPVAGVARVRLRAEVDLNSGRGKKDVLESVRRNMGS